MKCHDHLSSLKWHSSAGVVPYIYFDRFKLTTLHRHVLNRLIYSAHHLIIFTIDVYSSQQRRFHISNKYILQNITIDAKKIKSSLKITDIIASIIRVLKRTHFNVLVTSNCSTSSIVMKSRLSKIRIIEQIFLFELEFGSFCTFETKKFSEWLRNF